ncbi:long-chain-fatty-acid--CoA ligase [Bacillus sp. FJAT-29814]|uniref:long-chain-fatty-acid--CoA ligase n=1 Tax=Bacillus sp. FJAT-29814 TaxID=1729688 RepID=UPI00083619DF|nr:long-chain-fatty-acid--CoA ligase [Bacillus sp. FJAT-29814]
MELTIGNLFSASAAKYPEKIAVIYKNTRFTYREVEERSNRIANGLLKMGLKKGDRCAILFYNRAEWLEVYIGMAKVGIIAVPVNFRFVAAEIEYVINHSRPKAMIYEEVFEETISAIKGKLVTVKDYICLGSNHGDLDYIQLLEESNPNLEYSEDVNETDPFFFGYTSGTTGFPKGAVVEHRNLIVHHLAVSKELGGLNQNDKMLLIMPLFHSNSTWFLQMMAMIGGTAIIYQSTGFEPEEILSIIHNEQVTITSVVPTMLTMMLNLPDRIREKYSLSSLRVLLCSSAPLMTNTRERTLELFSEANLYEGYGATETGTVSLLPPNEMHKKLRSVGRPIIGKQVRLLDNNGNDVDVGEIGEIYVKGIGTLLKEYWEQPEATKEAFRGEWLSVGDTARMDKEGYLYLEDRKKDIIISGGENVYPTEVENVIAIHPSVAEVAVIGVPDEHWGERVHAVIELKTGCSCSEAEIIDFCRGKLAGYKRPRSVDFIGALAKNATGKIIRRKIRDPYWENVKK